MTTTEQYAQQIRERMARIRTSNTSVIVLSMIEAAIDCGGDLDAVKRILAAEKKVMDGGSPMNDDPAYREPPQYFGELERRRHPDAAHRESTR